MMRGNRGRLYACGSASGGMGSGAGLRELRLLLQRAYGWVREQVRAGGHTGERAAGSGARHSKGVGVWVTLQGRGRQHCALRGHAGLHAFERRAARMDVQVGGHASGRACEPAVVRKGWLAEARVSGQAGGGASEQAGGGCVSRCASRCASGCASGRGRASRQRRAYWACWQAGERARASVRARAPCVGPSVRPSVLPSFAPLSVPPSSMPSSALPSSVRAYCVHGCTCWRAWLRMYRA
jgi:hypothetical protein